MKLMNKKTITIVALLSMSLGSNIFAYTWSLTNKTDETYVIEFKLAAWHEGFYNIVKPNEKVEFSWPTPSIRAGYVLGGLRYTKYNPNIKKEGVSKNGGLDLINYKGRQMGWLTYPYNNGVSGMVDKDIGYLPYEYKELEVNCQKSGSLTEKPQGTAEMKGQSIGSAAAGERCSTAYGKDFYIYKTKEGKPVAVYQAG